MSEDLDLSRKARGSKISEIYYADGANKNFELFLSL